MVCPLKRCQKRIVPPFFCEWPPTQAMTGVAAPTFFATLARMTPAAFDLPALASTAWSLAVAGVAARALLLETARSAAFDGPF